MTTERKSLLVAMANKFSMEPQAFEQTMKATVLPQDVSNEQFAAFLMVAKEYDLNPLTKEIYGFPANGGIQPIVSIDGWLKMINANSAFDGMEFKDHLSDDGGLISVTCRMFRKDRSHPIEVTEYMSECKKNTSTWKQWPARMLRHKATIQAARYAFGYSGIYDPDEGERIAERDMGSADVVELDTLPPYPQEQMDKNLPQWKELIASGEKIAEQIIAMVSSKYQLTEDQIATIKANPETGEVVEGEWEAAYDLAQEGKQ